MNAAPSPDPHSEPDDGIDAAELAALAEIEALDRVLELLRRELDAE